MNTVNGLVYQIVNQDFAVAKAAFDDNDFSKMHIYGNRLVSNVLFGNDNEKIYALPGFFLKNLALELLSIKDDSLANELRRQAELFIVKIDRFFKEQADLGPMWTAYFEYFDNTRKLFLDPVERKIYRDNKSFTTNA